MIKIITTDSYFNLFPLLVKEIKKPNSIGEESNIVFCEEKISLMAERFIANAYNGTFNTSVFSFGNFLRSQKTFDKLLSKEGSSMVIRKILSQIKLECFKSYKTNLAPSLYNVIVQLKSAKVSVQDLEYAVENTEGILKSKLKDIVSVYNAYQSFIKQNGFEDQSSVLSFLPEIIENSEYVKNSNIYLFGFTDGLTRQLRSAIASLLKVAKSVTMIAVSGDNPFCYLNETANAFKSICESQKIEYSLYREDGGLNDIGKRFINSVYCPQKKSEKIYTENIKELCATSKEQEVLRVAETIKRKIIQEKLRYRDFTVALPNVEEYSEQIKKAFTLLDIPFFIDQKKVPDVHPLVTLITSYCDCFRKNFKRETVLSFCANPLVIDSKQLLDEFSNYCIKYNIDYGRIKEPFKYQLLDQEVFNKIEQEREQLAGLFSAFNVRKMLDTLNVKDKLENLSKELDKNGESETCAINDQIFEAVNNILDQMDLLLNGAINSITEYKTIFSSGISALEMSVIPQYNDAVFIGGLKETALVKAKVLFVLGLNEGVPAIKEDVSILSDNDLSHLESIKLLIEPKIRVVNHRQKESCAMAICSFSDQLYLSYSTCGIDGKALAKSQILLTAEQLFSMQSFEKLDGYLSMEEGLRSFAISCGKFANSIDDNFDLATAFYSLGKKDRTDYLLEKANKEMKIRISNVSGLYSGEVSPTLIESYYACPYKNFLDHGIRLKEQEQGELDSLSFGNIMHEVLNRYLNDIYKVSDKKTSDELVDKIREVVLAKKEFSVFLSDAKQQFSINKLFDECKRFCYKTYCLLNNSKFKAEKSNLEVKFGDGKDCKYPAILLADGRIKLCGKIDRIDTYQDYCRVIDYKTGYADDGEKSLFSGVKLQLFLYGSVVKGYKLAGAYYIPISDSFTKEEQINEPIAIGKTLLDKDIIIAQDQSVLENGKSEFMPIKIKDDKVEKAISEKSLQCYVDYALKISDKGAEQILDGVIVPSPIEETCKYCPYSAVCGVEKESIRTIRGVNEGVIVNAIMGEDDGT